MPAITVQKLKGENPQRAVLRFIKATKKSGVILEVKKRMFRDRTLNETKKKLSALHRLKKQKEYEALKKLGKI